MHADLLNWCNEIWRQKDTLLAGLFSPTGAGRYDPMLAAHFQKRELSKLAGKIYETYATAASEGATSEQDVMTFFGQLDHLESALQVSPEVQRGNGFKKYANGQMGEIFQALAAALAKKGARQGLTRAELDALEFGKQLGNAFFHYRKSRTACTERVYLNVKRAYRIVAFRTILAPLFQGEHAVPGLCNAKLTGPIGDDRPDSIVIYTTDARSSEAVIESVRQFQVHNQYCFWPVTPRLTRKVAGLIGVSTGKEPPDIALIEVRPGKFKMKAVGQQSFGSSRAMHIARALHHVKENPAGLFKWDSDKFKKKVVDYFRAGGIDPEDPSSQFAPGTLDG